MMFDNTLYNVLYDINNPLAKKLLNLYYRPQSILGLRLEDDGKISYIPKNKLVGRNYWSDIGRQSAKVATVVKKIIPEPNENEVRDLVEQFKAYTERDGYELSIVDGDDAAELYRIPVTQLSERVKPGTRLRNACFQGKLSEEKLQMFINNVHTIKMIKCLYKGKLDGRAMLIHGKDIKTGKTMVMLENLYTGSTQAIFLIRNLAKSLGACYYDCQYNWPDGTRVTDVVFKAELRPSPDKLSYLDVLQWEATADKTYFNLVHNVRA